MHAEKERPCGPFIPSLRRSCTIPASNCKLSMKCSLVVPPYRTGSGLAWLQLPGRLPCLWRFVEPALSHVAARTQRFVARALGGRRMVHLRTAACPAEPPPGADLCPGLSDHDGLRRGCSG